jgi:hypothetical protein
MKKLKIVFSNENKKQELLYNIILNPVSERWIKKIKHLSSIPLSAVETTGTSFADDMENLHREFCKFAGIKYSKKNYSEQQSLNQLHELYEKNHDRLSMIKNNDILYKFHNAIHQLEKENIKTGLGFYIGWGINEGPLEETFNCNEFYAETFIKNNLYLPWTELGKTPLYYYINKEPEDINRFCELAKPHETLRAKFMIALKDFNPPRLSQEFEQWFAPFKSLWLQHHNIKDWRACDEYLGVLLAEPEDKNIDIEQMLKVYPMFHSIKLV